MRIFLLLVFALTACEGSASSTDPDAAQQADGTSDSTTTTDAGSDTTTESDATRDITVSVDTRQPDQNDGGTISRGSAGCAVGAGIPEGENTFTLENRVRRYIVRLPIGYTKTRPWPLVFALHGNGGSAAYWDVTDGERDIRGVLENDAILIIAEAIDGQWRDYAMPEDTWPARIESELLYFDALITRAKNDLCVDEGAIFSMGFSGGGSFSGVLGCRRTDIRGIAVGGSVIYFDPANCIGTPAAWVAISEGDFGAGRAAYRDYFSDRAGCDRFAVEPNVCTTYANCGAETPVEYCPHPGGHIWPDFGSVAMWEFFQQLD